MRRLFSFSILFVATACVGIREDPRNTEASNVIDANGSGATGGTGGTGGANTGGTGGLGAAGGAGGTGGAPTTTLPECACGINYLAELSDECDLCIADQVLGNQLECDDVKVNCENDVLGCALAAGLVADCEIVDENCLNNFAVMEASSLELLSDYFACVCSPSVCQAACDPGGEALTCVVEGN